MSGLANYVDKRVFVVTCDGRTILGDLKGFDQTTNIILTSSVERIFSSDQPVEETDLDVYLLRGDNIVAIGEVDVVKDKAYDWESVRAEPIPELHH